MLRFLFLFLPLLAAATRAQAQQPAPQPRPPATRPPAPGQTAPAAPAPPLTLAQAIQVGLENNFDIRLARTDEQVAANNVSRGNAGQLPTVNGNLTRSFTSNNVRQESSARPEPSIISNAQSNLLNANVAATWTVFDGFGMFIAYDRLRALSQSQRQRTRATLEETVADITDAYYAVVREQGKIKSIEEALKIGQARLDLTQARVTVGVSAKVEVLTARVDYNADQSALIQQQEALTTAKITLNTLLGRAPRLNFSPTDSIVVTRGLDQAALVQAMQANNPRLQAAHTSTAVAAYDRRLARAARFPQVGLTSGYGLNRNVNGAAFFGSQLVTNTGRTYGLNYGLVASVPIFDGFNRRRLEQNARIGEERSQVQLGQTQLQLAAEAEQAYAQYQNRLQLLELEEANILLARQNVAIALERYRLGLLTPIVLREAQRTRLDAEVRLLDIRFQAKQAETVLRRLSGGLVK